MEQELKFYSKIPPIILITLMILSIVFNVVTMLLFYDKTYDYFIQIKYVLNRRILLKYLRHNKPVLVLNNLAPKGLAIYSFNNYELWIHSTLQISLSSNTDNNIIGLFTSSKKQDYYNLLIYREINKLKQ